MVGKVRGRKHERVGVVAALLGKSLIEPYQYGGTRESNFFEAWFGGRLLPAPAGGVCDVMDSASFHRKSGLPGLAERAGHRVLFPPYSPELNPIENFWGWPKRELRRILPCCPTFSDALRFVIEWR